MAMGPVFISRPLTVTPFGINGFIFFREMENAKLFLADIDVTFSAANFCLLINNRHV
jgi:hypothetical protein